MWLYDSIVKSLRTFYNINHRINNSYSLRKHVNQPLKVPDISVTKNNREKEVADSDLVYIQVHLKA